MKIVNTKPTPAAAVDPPERTLDEKVAESEKPGARKVQDRVKDLLDSESEKAEQLALEDEAAEEAPKVRLLPKTSPSATLGDTVIYRSQERSKQYNGALDHPAIVTRVWEKCVNLKVLPDCGEPYDATSQARINAADLEGQGWFTRGEAG